jgi:SAM-dependent methyltransferase
VPDSLSFDRAAEFYDATRAVPPEVIQETVALLSKETSAKQPALEVGIGTGRIGLPFSKANEVLGIDISMQMLLKLRDKSAELPIAQADATRLPFADNSIGSAYAIWVLHLISRWQDALREMLRVVRPGGVVLLTTTPGGVRGFGEGPWGEIAREFGSITGIERNVGVSYINEIDDFMATIGIQGRDAGTTRYVIDSAPAEMIRRLRENVFSFTWLLEDDARLSAVKEVEERARLRYGDLERPHAHDVSHRWRAYDIPRV